jgi:diketogulonate reductase-like aldo/keto reductase
MNITIPYPPPPLISCNENISTGLPKLIQGLALDASVPEVSFEHFEKILLMSLQNGIWGFDTSFTYGKSQKYMGILFKKFQKKGIIKREDIFITTKIKALYNNIEDQINLALKTLQVDYIDLILIHWPYPDRYIEVYKKFEKAYDSGKVKRIGISNIRERHLEALFNSGIKVKPHAIQIEYHPFRTVPSLINYCNEHGIIVQSYCTVLRMIPLVSQNNTLKILSQKYNKSIVQILLRWNIQQNIIPIFRSYVEEHCKEDAEVFDFQIEEEDMNKLFDLNIDYKLVPESYQCPGF